MKTALWFRRDLRVEDCGILSAASGEVLPLFIFDSHILDPLPNPDKRVQFLFHAVLRLKNGLESMGLNLAVFLGTPEEIFCHLKSKGISRVLASVDYDSYGLKRDSLVEMNLEFVRIQDNFLFDSSEVLTKNGDPYKVFTPYYRACLRQMHEGHHAQRDVSENLRLMPYAYEGVRAIRDGAEDALPMAIESIGFAPCALNNESAESDPGALLGEFASKMEQYEKNRDFPEADGTSRFSVHLRFGTLGIRQVIRALGKKPGFDFFLRELIWRDFYAMFLRHFPKTESENYQNINPRWDQNPEALERWQKGMTGVPIVDAGMRELYHSGYMHNRVRMIVASFLTKHLHLDWKEGEAWFAQKLLDYEASTNIGSWQWAASTGVDAQPYYRIFNPYLQSKRFDSEGVYIKRWLPELEHADSRRLHDEAWLFENPTESYLVPVVRHAAEREEALKRFREKPQYD